MLAQAEEARGYKEQLQEQLDEKLSEAGKRGYIKIGDTLNEIVLGKYSDVTTLQHELMHHWKNLIEILAAKGNKKAQALKAQMDKIIEENKDYVKQKENAEEEVLSEAYEAWLYTGVVAEDPKEQSLYEAIKQFFQDIYDSVQAITGIRINPEIDMFFRQMTGEMDIQDNEAAAEKLFNADEKDADSFRTELKRIINDAKIKPTTLLKLGRLPEVYVRLGLPVSDLNANKMTMLKGLGRAGKNKHNVPMEVLENLPELVADPLAVFKSSKDSSNPNGYVVVLDAKNNKGQQITAIISPKGGKYEFSFIPSVYERKDIKKTIQKAVDEGNVLYYKNETSLPSLHDAVLRKGEASTNNILTKEDIVKSQKGTMFQDGIKYDKNGKADINSPEFKKWFGNSGVVDEQGRPLVVYHGTPNAIFEEFRTPAYFTPNKEYAEKYQRESV